MAFVRPMFKGLQGLSDRLWKSPRIPFYLSEFKEEHFRAFASSLN